MAPSFVRVNGPGSTTTLSIDCTPTVAGHPVVLIIYGMTFYNSGGPGSYNGMLIDGVSVPQDFSVSMGTTPGTRLQMWTVLLPETGTRTLTYTVSGSSTGRSLQAGVFENASLVEGLSYTTGTRSRAITGLHPEGLAVVGIAESGLGGATAGTQWVDTGVLAASYLLAPIAGTAYTISWASGGTGNIAIGGQFLYDTAPAGGAFFSAPNCLGMARDKRIYNEIVYGGKSGRQLFEEVRNDKTFRR